MIHVSSLLSCCIRAAPPSEMRPRALFIRDVIEGEAKLCPPLRALHKPPNGLSSRPHNDVVYARRFFLETKFWVLHYPDIA